MKPVAVLLFAAMAVAGAAAASEFNFFPSAIFSKAPAAAGDAAPLKPFPSPWTLGAQTAYPELGNDKAQGLLKISVNDYFPDGPTLYVIPGAWCDSPGAPVPGPAPTGLREKGALVPESAAVPEDEAAAAAVVDEVPADAEPEAAAPNAKPAEKPVEAPEPAPEPAAEPEAAAPNAKPLHHRRLLQAEEPPAGTSPESALFTVDADGACTLAGADAVTFKVGKDGAPQTPEIVKVDGIDVYKIVLAPNLPDGEHCVEVTARYATASVKTTPAYTEAFEPLGDVTPFTRTVCLYKLTKQASASLDFDMCTNNEFTLNISNITPLPVNLTLDDTPVDKPLFTPLIKVFGGKVAELDGTPTEPRNYDEVASRTKYNWVARYFPVPSSYRGEPLSYLLSDSLQEGYYEVNSVVSVMTAYPELNSLIGLTQITQDDASGEGVRGMFEAASRQVHTKAIVGVQKGTTPTTLSSISSPSHARGATVAPGQKVVLTWQFRGIGSATCTHDGAPVSNAAGGKCVSPLSIEAADTSSVDTKHSVIVTFSDVCGRERNAEFEYTQAGVVPLTATEQLNPDGTITKLAPESGLAGALRPESAQVKSGAGAARGLSAAAALLLAIVAALLL